MTEFRAWPKTPRLFRDMVITEKLDGTNAAVQVEEYRPEDTRNEFSVYVPGFGEDELFAVTAQSRTRLITTDADNHGFAAWVKSNALGLASVLGVGVHYGEYWGSGIQRGYGLTKGEKRFSLFNVKRWGEVLSSDTDTTSVTGLRVVPVLYQGLFETDAVRRALRNLENGGSYAAPGFDKPEGVVVFHAAAGQSFKALLENDEISKTVAGE